MNVQCGHPITELVEVRGELSKIKHDDRSKDTKDLVTLLSCYAFCPKAVSPSGIQAKVHTPKIISLASFSLQLKLGSGVT
jgi:hypothetical protein